VNTALRALVCGYAPAERGKKLLAMVHVNVEPEETVAFTDESEGAGERRILLLSSCIQSFSKWEQFSDEWDKAMKEPPGIGAFHSREARGFRGNFKNWKAVDRDLKIIKLCEVILRHNISAFSVWISAKDYAETIQKVGPKDVRHAYFSAFTAIVLGVARYQNFLGSDAPIRYVFDIKGDLGFEAQLWYPAIRESAPKEAARLMGGTPSFEDDERVLPLQAADLVAWHKRRQKEFGKKDPECAATMRLDELSGGEMELPRRELEKTAEKMAAVPNLDQIRNLPSVYKTLKSQYRKRQRKEREDARLRKKND
jgi:hypothetical protein